jgi:hypothetical protein
MRQSGDNNGAGAGDSALAARYRAFRIACEVRQCWRQAAREAVTGRLWATGGEPAWTDPGDLGERIGAQHALLAGTAHAEYAAIAGAAADWAGRLAREIVTEPADGTHGLAIKLRVLRVVLGAHGIDVDGDPDLAAHEAETAAPFFDCVLADAERLAGAGA